MCFDDGKRRVYNRLGGSSTAPTESSKNQKVCYHWRAGRCNCYPCRFLHGELPDSSATANGSGAPKHFSDDSGFSSLAAKRGPNYKNTWVRKTYQKAWNTQTNSDLTLSGPVGQVYAMATSDDLLLAGSQDGTILAWKFNALITNNNFEAAASLKGHTRAVVSLAVGVGNRLYSSSVDHSIKVWCLDTLQCLQTLTEHTDVVMSLLCWEQFLLSCSLDQTIKVWWIATKNGGLEVTHTHSEEHGLLILRGMHDMESKPVLLCVCNDNSVKLYDLPSFSERGKIFAKQDIRAIEVGPDASGLFFSGDGIGFKVCKWVEAEAEAIGKS
ncbi:hypothetical protein CCACVL1_28293 [Corchorus capsularis]|uniref:IP5PC-F beta-propeller domain-containing protein n=1 Tax=Corchorus capsularis TaxID=210143 RepID=A0A1R3G6Y2_COCAP|nr:hypothetical protein CCACVL1_28293 [Corchorus capsularis]